MNNNVPVIYQIYNLINGKRYIGSTVSTRARWSEHRCSLKENKHGNIHLQNAWNKYGQSAFVFEIIHTVEFRHEIYVWEQFWIDWFKPEYNILVIACDSRLGMKNSPEAIAKTAAFNRGKKRPAHVIEALKKANTEKHPDQKTREKMAKRKRKLHKFQSPTGEIVEIYDLKRFCAENNLNQGHMAGVHNGRKYQYKGWTLPNPGPAPMRANEKGTTVNRIVQQDLDLGLAIKLVESVE